MIKKNCWENAKISTKYICIINIIILIVLSYNFLSMPITPLKHSRGALFLPLIFNLILAIMAVIVIIFYNFIFKRKEKYIFLLFYISIAIELMAKIANYLYFDDVQFGFFCLGTALRAIILSSFMIRDSKIFKKLTTFSIPSFLGFIFLNSMLIIIELKNLVVFDYSTAYIIYAIIFCLIAGCIIKCFIETIKNNDTICGIITLSLIFMIFKFLYQIIHVLQKDMAYMKQNAALSEILLFFSLLTIVSTVFIELLDSNKKLMMTQEDFNIFYRIVNENNYSKVLIYENGKMQYANTKARIEGNIELNKKDYFLKLEEYNQKNISEEKIDQLKKIFLKKQDVTVYVRDKLGKEYDVVYQNIKRERSNTNVDIYTIQNKSEIQYAKELIEINKSKFDFINKNIEEIIIVTDNEFKITYVNNYCKRAIGFDFESMKDKHIAEYLIKNKKEFFLESLNHEIADRCFDERILTQEGEYKNIKVKMDNVLDMKGNIISHVFVINSNNYEERLKELNIKMKEIEDGDLTRREIFVNLSHELRTPIHILYSSMQLLNNQKEDLSAHEFIGFYEKYEGVIRQNTKRMLRIVNNIIDISKIESGFVDLDLKIYNIVDLIEEISMSIIPYTKTKEINLIFDTNIEERFILCDPEKIERIFLNLLSNSIKFTDKNGDVFVNVDSNEDWITIKVRDTGCGIPKNMHTSIFDRFTQVKESLAKNPNGSGIGLSLVKSLVELHSGRVKINSELESGTEVIVCLPNISDDENEKNTNNKKISDTTLVSNLSVEFSDIQ